MKKVSTVVAVWLIISALVFGCAKKMNSDDFAEITGEWGITMIKDVLKNEDWNSNSKEIEKFAYRKLNEVCKKHGYSAEDYKRKAKELGKTWEDEWNDLWDDLDKE